MDNFLQVNIISIRPHATLAVNNNLSVVVCRCSKSTELSGFRFVIIAKSDDVDKSKVLSLADFAEDVHKPKWANLNRLVDVLPASLRPKEKNIVVRCTVLTASYFS